MTKRGTLAAAALYILCCHGVESLQHPPPLRRAAPPAIFGQIGAGAALVAAAAVTFQSVPAVAAPLSPPLQAAIIDTSDATYPVLQALSSRDDDAVGPFANKIAGLLTTKIPSDKAATALDKGIDAFLGIADADLDAFTTAVRESYSGVTPESCAAIKIPADALTKLSTSGAASAVDAEKLKAVDARVSKALAAFPKTADAICLPPTQEGLEKIWTAQTELSLSVPRRAAREFVGAAAVAGKSIPASEVLRILPEAKQLTKGLDGKTVKKFEMTGKTLDGVLKKDAGFARLLPQ